MPDVILPVLNEAAAIAWVLGRMPAGYAPIVVDNGCTDGSARIARRSGALVVSEPMPGFGAACFRGLVTATADLVCFMDCDGSLDPADLPRVSEPVLEGRADLVLGERRPERGAWPLHARMANRAIALSVRRRTRIPLHDLGPMRAGRREQLLALELQDRRFGWPLEMVLSAAAAGLRIHEVPVTYRARSGKSKVTGTVRGTARAAVDMARVAR